MRWLKQSTSVDVPIGPFLDATDGVTAETSLTITQPDVRLKKNGGAWAQKNAAQTLSHEENGFYEVTLDATDTGTVGLLRLAVFESGAAPVWEDFMVLPASSYDALIGGTGNGVRADVQALAASVITAAAIAADAGGELAAALLDLADGVESGFTVRQVLRLVGAFVAGEASGGGTNTVVFRSLADLVNRITYTTDADGNRTAVTLNLT